MSAVETGQMSAAETGQLSAVETGQMSAAETRHMSSAARADICLVSTHNIDVSEISIVAISQCSSLRKSVRPQIDENGPKWLQNGRQVVRIDPPACRGHFQASGTTPAAKNPPRRSKNRLFGVSRWGHDRIPGQTQVLWGQKIFVPANASLNQ